MVGLTVSFSHHRVKHLVDLDCCSLDYKRMWSIHYLRSSRTSLWWKEICFPNRICTDSWSGLILLGAKCREGSSGNVWRSSQPSIGSLESLLRTFVWLLILRFTFYGLILSLIYSLFFTFVYMAFLINLCPVWMAGGF